MPGDSQRTSVHALHTPLRWHETLLFKLTALFLGLAVILGTIAVVVSQAVVRDGLVDETFRYERESGRRLALEFDGLAQRTQTLAANLAQLALTPPAGGAALRPPVPELLDHQPDASIIAGIGVWPEPGALNPATERSSLLWMRDSSGALRARTDYNDPRTVPYFREKWYTPARYAQKDHCYWTPVYREPLSQRDVITCSMPLLGAQGFLGVVTIHLSVVAIETAFGQATQHDLGYSLLLDHDSRLLGVSGNVAALIGAARPRNLAELAKSQQSLNPVALALHQMDQDTVSAAARSPLYDSAQIEALRQGSRDMSRAEAEAALSAVWSAAGGGAPATEPQQVRIEDDRVLDDDGFATVFRLPGSDWWLVRVTPMKKGFAGASYLFTRSLLINLGILLFALLGIFGGLRLIVMMPLQRMVRQLANSGSVEDSVHVALDETPRNELGSFAYWYNERIRQMRELMERAIATNAQLVMEADERRNAQEALARVQERASLALQSVADGVITTDERGRVEDMNPVAEQLTGVSVRAGRGKPFSDIFTARAGSLSGALLPNLADLAIQRGTRLEYAEGVALISFGGAIHDVHLTITPIRTRQNRIIGTVIVFRDKAPARHAAGAQPTEFRTADNLTGLPMRAACDRRIRALIESAKLAPRTHALLFLDVDNLKRINDSNGQNAGDEVIAKIGAVLTGKTGSSGEVFRLSGDQFAVLLEDFDATRASAFAEDLRETLAATPLQWESRSVSVTASFGVTEFDGLTGSSAEVIQRADNACIAAKHAGRNRVQLWSEQLQSQPLPVDDEVWIQRIRAGLERDLFHLTTQLVLPAPLHSAEGQAFEILLALEDEEGFWSPAAAFLPAAERHHLAPEMDRWVVSHSIAHLAANPELAARIAFVTLNISPASLADIGLLEHIVRIFQNTPNVPAGKICFEISEDTVTDYPQQSQVFCDAMRALGCRLSVDRFTGRRISELSLLRRLPLEFLKVDASHFHHIATDPVEQMLAESLVRMAKTLNKKIIAANLEEVVQQDAWRRLGVDYFQGHVIAKPSPVIFTTPYAAA